MTVSVSILETTVRPAEDGYDVQIFLSDKPRDAPDAALAIAVHARIDLRGTASLAGIQRRALEDMRDALTPVMQELQTKIQNLRS